MTLGTGNSAPPRGTNPPPLAGGNGADGTLPDGPLPIRGGSLPVAVVTATGRILSSGGGAVVRVDGGAAGAHSLRGSEAATSATARTVSDTHRAAFARSRDIGSLLSVRGEPFRRVVTPAPLSQLRRFC